MFIFPGLGLGASLAGVETISDGMLYAAAVACANTVTHDEIAEVYILYYTLYNSYIQLINIIHTTYKYHTYCTIITHINIYIYALLYRAAPSHASVVSAKSHTQ